MRYGRRFPYFLSTQQRALIDAAAARIPDGYLRDCFLNSVDQSLRVNRRGPLRSFTDELVVAVIEKGFAELTV